VYGTAPAFSWVNPRKTFTDTVNALISASSGIWNSIVYSPYSFKLRESSLMLLGDVPDDVGTWTLKAIEDPGGNLFPSGLRTFTFPFT